MAYVWPESAPSPHYPLIVTPRWQTNVVNLGDATEQRRTHWLFPVFDVTVNYVHLTAAHAQTLWQFFMARRGAYEAFYIFDLALLASVSVTQTTALYIGTGDGSTTIFDIPGRSTSSQTIYVDGVADGSASVLVGGGDGSSDRASWATAPAAGAVLSAIFTGYARFKVRFEFDYFSRELFTTNLFRTGSIQLKGVK